MGRDFTRFPKCQIVQVDGNKSEEEMWKAIQAGLDQAGIKPLPKEKPCAIEGDAFVFGVLNIS